MVIKMAYEWTQEQRNRRAEAIKKWKPWEKSTGPRTPDGKAKVATNAYKGGINQELRQLAKLLRESKSIITELTLKIK